MKDRGFSIWSAAIDLSLIHIYLALGIGGVPRGRIVEIYGPESCGKTTLALHVVASAQKGGGEAAYIDCLLYTSRCV